MLGTLGCTNGNVSSESWIDYNGYLTVPTFTRWLSYGAKHGSYEPYFTPFAGSNYLGVVLPYVRNLGSTCEGWVHFVKNYLGLVKLLRVSFSK